MVTIITRKQKRHPKRPQPSILCVSLFVITNRTDELLDRDGFLVLVEVTLGGETGLVDEDVGVRGQAGDDAGDVSVDLVDFVAVCVFVCGWVCL